MPLFYPNQDSPMNYVSVMDLQGGYGSNERLLRWCRPTEYRFGSRCVILMIEWVQVFPPWHRPLCIYIYIFFPLMTSCQGHLWWMKQLEKWMGSSRSSFGFETYLQADALDWMKHNSGRARGFNSYNIPKMAGWVAERKLFEGYILWLQYYIYICYWDNQNILLSITYHPR